MTELFKSPPQPRSLLARLLQQKTLNYYLSNCLPRRWITVWMGRFSRIDSPWLARLSIATWRLFAPELDLSEAKKTHFCSLHDCFIRELKPGSRPVDADPGTIISPCDAMLMAAGRIRDTTLIQAKGMDYCLEDLLLDPALAQRYRDGVFVTLRLKSTMYHRFHAPTRCRVREVNYVAGDVWNVNPPTVERVRGLYCRNERAIIDLDTDLYGASITLVPVAAILVASIHLHFLDVLLHLGYAGPNRIACDASLEKGEELGYFHHGSTIIVLATAAFRMAEGLEVGATLRAGEPLLIGPRGEAGAGAAHDRSAGVAGSCGSRE